MVGVQTSVVAVANQMESKFLLLIFFLNSGVQWVSRVCGVLFLYPGNRNKI